MIILGIDPGFARCGYGVLDAKKGSVPRVLCYGCWETPATMDHGSRLAFIYNNLEESITQWKVEIMALEKLFFSKNVKTALAVGEARGIIVLAAARAHLHLVELGPMQVKQALTGFGRAEKPQMQQMVKMVLKLNEIPKPDDAADALAIAYAGWVTL